MRRSRARLTLPDFILAAKLDALPVDYSPKWLREHAAAADASAADASAAAAEGASGGAA
jgi:hypothetical protein